MSDPDPNTAAARAAAGPDGRVQVSTTAARAVLDAVAGALDHDLVENGAEQMPGPGMHVLPGWVLRSTLLGVQLAAQIYTILQIFMTDPPPIAPHGDLVDIIAVIACCDRSDVLGAIDQLVQIGAVTVHTDEDGRTEYRNHLTPQRSHGAATPANGPPAAGQ